MLNRLLTSLAIVSAVAALAVGVIWWRADHGHADTFHMGAASATRTTFVAVPGGRVAVQVENHDPAMVQGQMRFYPMRSVLGGCLMVPALWAAVHLRRRLLPRPPGAELPAMRGMR